MQRLVLAAYVSAQNRYREARDLGSERGLTTTEIAVLTFVLVTTAVAIGAALYAYAGDQVENLPDNPAADIQTE